MQLKVLAAPVFCVAMGAMLVHAASQDVAGGSPFTSPAVNISSPALPGSAQPNLTADRAGRVWLSWLEPTAGGRRFRLAELAGQTFKTPVTIAEGATLLANWADFPSVFASSTGSLMAHWLERSGAPSAYGIKLRSSSDGGRTWTPAVSPHPAASPGEHGFVSFFEAPDRTVGLAWLDGRDAASHGAPAASAAAHGAMTLRAATITRGTAGEDQVVDARVCDCCQTSAATTDDGVVVAYRDRTDDEIRDIVVSTFSGGRWSAPVPVHQDGWRINGCPVNGPAIAALGRTVVVTWFTQAAGAPEARAAFSTDGGRQFAPPVRVSAATTFGRLAVQLLDNDRAVVTSIERDPDGTWIIAREVRRDGRVGAPVRLAPTSSDRPSGFPRLVRSGGRLVVAWTDSRSTPSHVNVASVTLR